MRLISFLIFLLVFTSTFNSFSQSVYDLKYNFHQPDDTIDYQVFFMQYENGTALARIRYINPSDKEVVLVEMNMEEQYILDKTGVVDTGRVLYKSTGHKFISKDDKAFFNPAVAFIFKTDSSSGFSEPTGVISEDTRDVEIMPGTSFTSTFMERHALKPVYVRQFFGHEEDFYTSLFPTGTKGPPEVDYETRMFLLVVANVWDKDIGISCAKDTGKVIESFTDIALKLGLLEKNIIVKVIAAEQYTKKNVELAIANFIKPTPNKDIVVFYYSGHGFRKTTQKKISQFPYMDLRSKNDSDYYSQSLNIEKDIFDKIVSKKARFNLVLGDCCNTYAPVPKVESPKPAHGKGSGFLLSPDNCKALFMEKLSILACAADSNQLATSNKDFGGFFSYFLKASMENYCSIFEKDVTWKKVLDDTFKQTIFKAEHTYCDLPRIPANICNQRPIMRTIPAVIK